MDCITTVTSALAVVVLVALLRVDAAAHAVVVVRLDRAPLLLPSESAKQWQLLPASALLIDLSNMLA